MGANTSKHHQGLKASSSTTSTSRKGTNNRLPPQKLEDLVDLGTVFPNGLYPATEQDYDARIVKKLIIQRRISPFYKGLADAPKPVTPTMAAASSSSTDSAADAADAAADSISASVATPKADTEVNPNNNLSHAGNGTNSNTRNNIPTNISFSSTSDIPKLLPKPVPQRSVSSSSLLEVSAATKTKYRNNKPLPGRPRSQSHSKVNDASYDPYAERKRVFVEKMKQREKMLYNDAVECPICFLFYPANINYSRCCDQPICTECFVQIHRPLDAPSQPATCPFCTVENYGVVYEPPAWSEKAPQQGRARSGSHSSMSGTRHTTSGIGGADLPTRRASIDHKDPDVVLVDHVRPDWNKALLNTKAHSARTPVSRRNSVSAAHTLSPTASLSNNANNNSRSNNTSRNSRHNHLFFRSSSSSNNSSNGSGSRSSGLSSLFVTRPGRSASSAAATEYNQYLTNMRDSNMDLEDWMVMEAIRLSLAEQEECERKEALEETKKKKKQQGQSSNGCSSKERDTRDNDQSEPQGVKDTQKDITTTAATPLSSSSSGSLSSSASSTRKETATTTSTDVQPLVN